MIPFRLLLPVAIFFLAACASIKPTSREQVAKNLAPMVSLEKRVDKVRYYTQWLVLAGGIDNIKVVDLKARHDVYFVYYLAANVDLASGDVESFQANLERAEREVEFMEATLKASLAELNRPDRGVGKKQFPPYGL